MRARTEQKCLQRITDIKESEKMKTYENPFIDITTLSNVDVIATSDVGTETSRQDENDPMWDLNIGG